ncbi:MAG: sulfurtransferase TusA family protein [Spirochaetales bacterium]|nr:sulfurtransferase TusA family protein [Spirochaetales bacterium]
MEIDCRGLSCPEPVIRTKKAIKDNPESIDVLVDQRAPLENVQRFLKAMKYNVTAEGVGSEWRIKATR